MGLFDQFPYTNFHELNLMWILEALKEIKTTTEQFVAINSLKYADPIQWSIIRQYEKNTIVIDPLSGTAYISVQPVPSGVALTNTDYWTVVFDLGAFVVRASKNFAAKYEDATTLTATFPSSVNDWLIWGDVLYKVISPIVAGDQYIVDSNIKHFTMEDLVGHLEDLTTTDKSNLVAAINEVLTTLANTTGDLADLNTTDKSNLVAAINEIITTFTQAITSEATARAEADTELTNKIDTLNYINVDSFGAVGDGQTDDSAAINEALTNSKFVTFTTGKTYLINSPLYLHRNQIVNLNGCTIKQGTPTITFTNDPNDQNASDAIGYTTVMNGNIYGSDVHTAGDGSKGLYVAAFYCNFKDLLFYGLDYGIHNRERFTYPASNLNNNLYSNLRFSNCDVYALKCDRDGDGQINNIWAGNTNTPATAEDVIHIENGAGWIISNVHLYGNAKQQLYMTACANTTISNCYFEGRTTHDIINLSAHGKCNISNCIVNACVEMTQTANNAAMYLHKSGNEFRAVFNISDICFGYIDEFAGTYPNTVELVRSLLSQETYINASNIFINIPSGDELFVGGAVNAHFILNRTTTTGGFREFYNGNFASGKTNEIVHMNSNTLTFVVPKGVNAANRPRAVVKVYISGGASYSQAQGWAELTLYFKYDGTYQLIEGKADYDGTIITGATSALNDETVTITLNRSVYGIAAIEKFIY